jgi:HAD superfamily hydrolase (TIGR01509 family)
MIKGAIFDVDGTLINSMPAWETVGSTYVKEHGLTPAEDLDKRVKECCLRDVSVIMQNEYGIDKSLDQIETELSKMVEYKYYNTIPLKPGVEALLEGLQKRGVKMCLASASRYDHIQRALTRCGVMKYFTKIFSCIDVGSSKREHEIYKLAMEHLGTEPENTYMFDDALYVAQTAGSLGIHCVGMYDEYMFHQDELRNSTEYYVEDYNDLSGFWAWFDK